MKDFIPFALHDIDDNEIAEVVDTLKSNWITTGPKTALFEKVFSEYIGAKYSLAVNSATAGLHLALECIGLKPYDYVITTPFTFTATAEVIRYFNADPIFIDIQKSDYNIDTQKIEEFCREECFTKNAVLYYKKTNRQIKAIIPVHMAGYPCNMDKIIDIASRYNLKVIEDAAHALPSFYKGRKIGTISDITVFSFYATKTMTTGEGGMIVTNNIDYHNRMKIMRLHGINRDVWDRYNSKLPNWYYEIVDAGYKYNMTDIAASLGIQQLKKLDSFHKKRKLIASLYNETIGNIEEIDIPRLDEDSHSWHLYIIQLKSKRFTRDDFINMLFKKGVGTSVHFIPLHLHPYYKEKYGFSTNDFPVAYKCFKRVISLPIYTKMTEQDVLKVANTIKELIL